MRLKGKWPDYVRSLGHFRTLTETESHWGFRTGEDRTCIITASLWLQHWEWTAGESRYKGGDKWGGFCKNPGRLLALGTKMVAVEMVGSGYILEENPAGFPGQVELDVRERVELLTPRFFKFCFLSFLFCFLFVFAWATERLESLARWEDCRWSQFGKEYWSLLWVICLYSMCRCPRGLGPGVSRSIWDGGAHVGSRQGIGGI